MRLKVESIFSLRLTAFLVLMLVLSKLFSAEQIPLKWIGTKPNGKTAVSWGVPFAKGEVKQGQYFLLLDDNQTIVAPQTWPMAYWPDGSLKWVGFAAVVNPSEQYFIEMVNKTDSPTGIKVLERNDNITIKSATLSCEISKQGTRIFNYLKVNNSIVSENGRLVCTLENREKEKERILSYEDYESKITEVIVEQSGPVRAVVKISGTHHSVGTKREILPFVVRLYFYAGINEVKMVHSFVFDGDQNKDFVKALGVVFDLPLKSQAHNRYVRFSGQNGGLWNEAVKPLSGRYPFVFNGDRTLPQKQFAGEILPEIDNSDSAAFTHFNNFASWSDYKLTQLSPNGFQISKRTNKQSSWVQADAGKRSEGLVMLGDANGGLAVSLKDFWQSYPASLEISEASSEKAQIKIWLWSPEAESMDLRHYDTIPHDLLSTYEDVQPGLSTPYGIARTSELTIFAFDKIPEKTLLAQMSQSGANAPQLVCKPEYLHSVRAFGIWSLPDYSNQTKRDIESQLDSSLFYYQMSIDERHWYGFWNYGDVMHTYDANRHVWKYDVGGFAWANTELAPGNWLWYSFLRTGREDIYEMAIAMSRHSGEVDAYHMGEMKGLGTRHNVSHWGCGAKEARIGQAAWKRFQYYLTTDERCGDLMRESLDVEKSLIKYDPLRIAQPREKFPYSGPVRLRWGPDWLALAGNWMTEWERTGNIEYRNKIIAGLDGLSVLPNNLFTGPNGLSFNPETGKIWYDGKAGVTNQNHLATIMGGYEILLELFDMIDHPAFRKQFSTYCKLYGMSANDPERNDENSSQGNVTFRTPRLTAFAAKELKDDKLAARAWSEFLGGRNLLSDETSSFRNLYGSKIISGAEVLNPFHENLRVSTNGTAQWGLNAIIMLELIGDKIPDPKTAALKKEFSSLVENEEWNFIFDDNMQSSWKKNWFLDGEKAKLTNSRSGLLFKAGPTAASDADHSVLWTKQSFEGDIRIEFDFIKKDNATKFVNILYLFAEGSGTAPYDYDISAWNNLRTIPAMNKYFEHMNAYHISFAAFENDNDNPNEDYIRARRYLPERGKGLNGTDLKPDNLRTSMFRNGEKYHITIIKKGDDIFMQTKGTDKDFLCRWKTNEFPPLRSGRIGVRLMGSRISEFSNFKVFNLLQ